MVKAALLRLGGFQNLRLYSPRDPRDFARDKQVHKRDQLDGLIGPTFNWHWDTAYDAASQWADNAGTAKTYLENPPHPFDGNVAGLNHVRTVLNTPSSYTGFPILTKQPFALRALLLKKPALQPRRLWQAVWGRYQMEVSEGSFSVMRQAQANSSGSQIVQRGWSAGEENTMNGLLNQTDILASDQATIDDIKKNIYIDITALSLDTDGDDYFTLAFIPFDYGLIVAADNGKVTIIPNSDQVALRTPGTMWDSTQLTVKCNGGAYLWQVGWPSFAPTSQMRLGPINTQGHTPTSLGTFVYNLLADTLGPGCNLTIDYEALNGYWIDIVVTFTAGAGNRYPALMSAMSGVVLAGDRDGEDTTATVEWDSETYRSPSSGGSCIRDAHPSYEGQNRRVQWSLQLGDISGFATAALLNNYEYLEQRINRVSLGDLAGDWVPALNNAIVVRSQPTNLRQGTPALPRGLVTRPETKAILTTCNGWAQLEEHLMDYEIAADDRHLGDLCYIVLKNAGWKAAELSGVSRTYGIVIPGAIIGETWALANEVESSSADFLREVLDQFGFGALLFQSASTGIWTITDPPSTTKVLNGFPVAFYGKNDSVGRAHYSSTTYPGRYAVLEPYEWDRDISDFYNILRVEGGTDAQDLPLTAEWVITSSIVRVNGTSNYYIGRQKRAKTVQNRALKTQDQVNATLRSLVLRYGLPPRFHMFRTHFIDGLYPGDLPTVWGIPTRLEKIGEASLFDDMMSVVLRETGN